VSALRAAASWLDSCLRLAWSRAIVEREALAEGPAPEAGACGWLAGGLDAACAEPPELADATSTPNRINPIASTVTAAVARGHSRRRRAIIGTTLSLADM